MARCLSARLPPPGLLKIHLFGECNVPSTPTPRRSTIETSVAVNTAYGIAVHTVDTNSGWNCRNEQFPACLLGLQALCSDLGGSLLARSVPPPSASVRVWPALCAVCRLSALPRGQICPGNAIRRRRCWALRRVQGNRRRQYGVVPRGFRVGVAAPADRTGAGQ